MTEMEWLDVRGLVCGAWGGLAKRFDDEHTVSLWCEVLRPFTLPLIKAGVVALAAEWNAAYPPNPGQLAARCRGLLAKDRAYQQAVPVDSEWERLCNDIENARVNCAHHPAGGVWECYRDNASVQRKKGRPWAVAVYDLNTQRVGYPPECRLVLADGYRDWDWQWHPRESNVPDCLPDPEVVPWVHPKDRFTPRYATPIGELIPEHQEAHTRAVADEPLDATGHRLEQNGASDPLLDSLEAAQDEMHASWDLPEEDDRPTIVDTAARCKGIRLEVK